MQVHRWPYYKLQIPALFCEISNSRIHLRHALTLVNSKLVVYIRGGFRPTPAALFVHRPRPFPPFPRSPESKKNLASASGPRPQIAPNHTRERERERGKVDKGSGGMARRDEGGGAAEPQPAQRGRGRCSVGSSMRAGRWSRRGGGAASPTRTV